MMIVDCHIHVWTGDDPKYPMYIPQEEYPWWEGTTEDYIAEMDAAGIDRAVIVQIPYHRYDHSYVLKAQQDYPERFVVVGLLDPQASDNAETLRGLVQQHQVKGVRLSPGAKDRWLTASELAPLWRAAGDVGAHLQLQIGPSHLPDLIQLARMYPKTRIVVDHVAGVDLAAGPPFPQISLLFEAAECPNVYVKTSHLYGLNRPKSEEDSIPPLLEQLRSAFGAGRLMFGSNWPLVRSRGGLNRCLQQFKEAIASFSTQEQEAILGGTASRVYE